MKKIIFLLFIIMSCCGMAEQKYLGKVLAITSTKNPTTQYHIIYTTQTGVVGVVENINLKEQLTINTSTYCIHGFLVVDEKNDLMNNKHYTIQDAPPGEQKWNYATHQNEITSLQYEVAKLKEELKKATAK